MTKTPSEQAAAHGHGHGHRPRVEESEAAQPGGWTQCAGRDQEQAMRGAPAAWAASRAGDVVCHHPHHHHDHHGRCATVEGMAGARAIFPSAGTIVQAGAFGAALGGMTTGVVEMARVKQGEISGEEATRNVVRSSAQGAATMAVASVAGQLVRSHPIFGFIALAAAGIGAFAILTGAGTGTGKARPASTSGPARKTAPAKKPA